MRAFKPPLPKEHGSWVMFAAALVAGFGTAAEVARPWAPRALPAGVLFVAAALAFFCVRRPLTMLLRREGPAEEARRWAAFEAAVGLSAGLGLLVLGRLVLLPLGLLATALLALDLERSRRSPRPTAASEAAGALGLSLLAPAACAALAGRLPAPAPGLGLVLALHFLSGVLYVRMKVRWVRRPPATPRQRLATAWDVGLYSVAALLGGWALARAGLVPPSGWLALLPAAGRGLAGALFGRRETGFKRVGWRETGYTAAAVALWLIALAGWRPPPDARAA